MEDFLSVEDNYQAQLINEFLNESDHDCGEI